MSARTRSKATPRRKAGSKAPKAKRLIAFRLVVEDQEMLVRYTPNYFGAVGPAHFEYRSPHKPPRGTPVSDTGYLSDFVDRGAVARAGGPEAYARAYVLSVLDGERKPVQAQKDRRQLSLF